MNKIKQLWTNNRIVFVLVCILIICFIAIIVVASTFFLAGNKSSYGDRLNDIEKHPVSDEIKNNYSDEVNENSQVKSSSLRVSGRIIYVTIIFNEGTSLEVAEGIATKSIDLFEEDLLAYYDINFILKCDKTDSSNGFTIMGARNAYGNGVVWNNNTEVKEESEN